MKSKEKDVNYLMESAWRSVCAVSSVLVIMLTRRKLNKERLPEMIRNLEDATRKLRKIAE